MNNEFKEIESIPERLQRRFEIRWINNRTEVVLIDGQHPDYRNLTVTDSNAADELTGNESYVVAQLPFGLVEELMVNFLEQGFWSGPVWMGWMERLYGDLMTQWTGQGNLDEPDYKRLKEKAVQELEKAAGQINEAEEVPQLITKQIPMDLYNEDKAQVAESSTGGELGAQSKDVNAGVNITVGTGNVYFGDKAIVEARKFDMPKPASKSADETTSIQEKKTGKE